jgi:hypothetical protein
VPALEYINEPIVEQTKDFCAVVTILAKISSRASIKKVD